MSAAPNRHARPGQGLRRTRYALSSAVLILATVVAAALAVTISSKYHVRWDLTATREHSLSERTVRALSAIQEPVTLIVSADSSSLDNASRRRMADLVDALTRSSPKVESAWIDTGSSAGQAQFRALLEGLAQRDADLLSAQREALARAADGVDSLRASLGGVSDAARALADALDRAGLLSRREELDRLGGVARTLAPRLEPVSAAIRAAADHAVAGVLIPAPDLAQERATQFLSETARAMAATADFAAAFQGGVAGEPVPGAARALDAAATAARDQAARSADALARLRASDPLAIARVLQATSAVLAASPSGTVAIEFGAIFPGGAGVDSALPSAFAGEELISTALASLSSPVRPILVFVHAEAGRLLDDRGVPSAAAMRAFRRLFDRLRFARVDAAEWAVIDTPLRPDYSLDASGARRPVIWLILPPPSRAGLDPRQAALVAERQERVHKLGAALGTLVADAQNFLLCVDPSDRPAIGENDPIVAPLEALGMRVESGRPLLRRESSPQGPLTYTHHIVRGTENSHPIGRALRGLATALPWATCIEPIRVEGASFWSVLALPSSADTWGEAQWLALRDLVARGLARPLEPVALADPPAPNEGRDRLAPPGGAGWTVVAAAERSRVGQSPQRAIVVGSPTWIDDLYLGATETIVGRRALRFPGNAELLDASMAWLAGHDEMIAPGPQVHDVPRIRPIDPGALTALRWAVALAPPLLILIAGALLRVWRG